MLLMIIAFFLIGIQAFNLASKFEKLVPATGLTEQIAIASDAKKIVEETINHPLPVPEMKEDVNTAKFMMETALVTGKELILKGNLPANKLDKLVAGEVDALEGVVADKLNQLMKKLRLEDNLLLETGIDIGKVKTCYLILLFIGFIRKKAVRRTSKNSRLFGRISC